MTTTGFKWQVKLAAMVVAAVAVTVTSAPADAASCDQLRARYIAAGSGGGGGGSASNVRSLRNRVASLEAQARRKNCRGLGIFRKQARDCGTVMSRLNSAQRDLARAGGSRRSTANNAERSRLYTQLRRNGCSIPTTRGSQWAGSGYRTLCVRTCDGYYFPISFAAARGRIKTDEMVCKSMYGGANAELFYHNNGRGPEDAVSASGQRLESQPYAFSYRETFKDSCQAELKTGIANLGVVFADRIKPHPNQPGVIKPLVPRKPSIEPRPIARSEPGTDPDTLANREGEFVVKPVRRDAEDGLVTVAGIRRYGPDYYYEEPEEITAIYEAPDLGPAFTLIGSAKAEERTELTDEDATMVR